VRTIIYKFGALAGALYIANAMAHIPFPLDQLALNAPVPVNLWDPNGTLLLRKGEVILDERHRGRLQMHLPVVDEEEYRAWTYRYTTALDRMVRNNQRLEAIAGVERPMGVDTVAAPSEASAVEVWPDLHDTLATLLHQGASAHDFMDRLAAIERRIVAITRSRVDDSLFVLVQLLQDVRVGYSATHALLCAVLLRLVAPQCGLDEAQTVAAQRAALTMNIGMSHLHDALARQAAPLTPAQRDQIRAHPGVGMDWLQQLGVSDGAWLTAVRDHHETPTGAGYPAGRRDVGTLAQLLRLADTYVARLGPRVHRPGLPSPHAAREAYLGPDGQPSALGAAFVKALGAYIPGSHVRLVNGEMGVVVRRGRRSHTPLVMALVGRRGLPLGEPALRDTSEAALEVQRGLGAHEVKVRVPASRLLARL